MIPATSGISMDRFFGSGGLCVAAFATAGAPTCNE